MSARQITIQKTGRRTGLKVAMGLNTGAALLLFALLIVMVNYVAARYAWFRFDLSESKQYTLSEKTKSVLSGLTNTISITVFLQRGQEIFDDVSNLLKEYEYVGTEIEVEYVDPDRNLARTETLAQQYGVRQPNVIVFDNGRRNKYLSARDLYAHGSDDEGSMGGPAAPIFFRGELLFTSAIQDIETGKRPIVYFLKGHGERDVNDFDPYTGYSSVSASITRDNVEVRSLTLGASPDISDDCDALIIAGPKKKISQLELDIIQTYLDKNGKLFILLDAFQETGLALILEQWGVRLREDIVVDPTRTLTGRELFVMAYDPHPITERLSGITSVFYSPRSIEALGSSVPDREDTVDKPRVIPLASCTTSGWSEGDGEETAVRFDPDRDRPGPVSIGVAVERGPVPDIDMQIQPTRMVVLGDSDFISNGALTGGNIDFFMGALNWLLQRETLMAISAKELSSVRFTMSRRQLSLLFWLVVVGLPGSVGVLGLLVWFGRRS